MGKKCKKKVQWRPLSLNEPQKENLENKGSEFDVSESRSTSPSKEGSREHYQSSRGGPHKAGAHFRRHHHYTYYDKRPHQDQQQQPCRAYDNRHQPYDNRPPPYNIYDNRVPYNNKFHGDRGGGGYYYDHPKYYHRGPPHGFIDGSGRGRSRPFRPYPGRHGGFFVKGYHQEIVPVQHEGSETQEEGEEEWLEKDEDQSNCDSSEQDSTERPSQPVRTVLINNEEYTKIQTPRQEVMFKKSSLDRKRDSIDQSSVTGSMSESGSGLSSGEGGSGQGDQASLADSTEDGNIDVAYEDDNNLDTHQDAMYDDPSEMFAGEPGQPPLAGVVMQQAYPGGPMVSIPVHWTPFIDPSFIPGETALTPLDPAFTHVLDSSDLPIDPIHILPMQHDAQGCPVQVQVKVDENGQPIRIEPSAFTVSLSSLHSHSMDPSLHDTSLLHDHHAMQEQDKLYMDQLVQDTQELLTKDSKDQISKEDDTLQQDTTTTQEPTDTQTVILDNVQQNTEKTQDGEVNECVIDDDKSNDNSERIENSESDSVNIENNVPCIDLSKALEINESIPSRVPIAVKAKDVISQVEQEEEEDEDMITKDVEEGSDSNDSQYASMSESGSTPHSPAGEPCEANDDACNPEESCSTQRGSDPEDEQQENLRNNMEDAHPEHDDKQQENQSNTLKGYVMVPILTPYYDPSVLYGYQLVVDQSQQQAQVPQLPQLPQPQHQHRYGKRKKKKNQRRRHTDFPSTGGFLDPQLYTGEPFVAAPGSFMVPYDSSICHVHGIPYMPHQLHPQMSHDEGFSSLQHSPYLPETATEPHIPHGHNLDDDTSKNTVFGDLQEKERRQIQEILHERNKVGKSESIDSSDSGVSESEETAVIETSSGKLRERRTSQGSKHSDNTEEIYSASSRENKSDAHIEHSENLQEGTINSECSSLLTGELSEFNNENSVSNTSISLISSCQESDEKDNLLISVSDKTTEVLQSINFTDGSEIKPNVDSFSLESNYPNELVDQVNGNPIFCKNENVTSECGSDDIDNCLVPNSFKLSANRTENVNQNSDKDISDLSYENLKSLNVSSIQSGLKEKCFIESSDFSECLSGNFDSSEVLPNIEDIIFKNSKENNSVNSQESITEIEKKFCIEKDFVQLNSTKDSKQNEKVKSIQTELKTLESEVFKTENGVKTDISIQDTGGTIEHSIDQENLKDLKVTEAVKRWIREVTPEKAFTLSEEVQELLMSQQEFSDDEYIEDEIEEDTKSINVMDPKNVQSNPFGAASNESLNEVMECCSKRVASVTNEIVDEYDGESTISNLSHGRLYSESSLSFPPSMNQSFDEVDEEETSKGTEKVEIYNPNIYAKYYQLGVDMEDTTLVVTPRRTHENSQQSQYGAEDMDTVSHKFNTTGDYSGTSPLPLSTKILKAEKTISNMRHITGINEEAAHDALCLNSPDLYLKHYGASLREVVDSGVQSEESSDEIEARSKSGVSSGIGSSLASTPALSPLHYTQNTAMPHSTHKTKSNHHLSHPLRNLTAVDGPVPCKTVCCSVM